MPTKSAVTFAGSIPENYDKFLGPLLMVPSANDLARRLPISGLSDVLELACGTGILTQILRDRLGENTRLVATDISNDMIEIARAKNFEKNVEWKAVDATDLPFKDHSFDVVICQYGVMFFPDKPTAIKEIFRVLRPGGKILFNVWDKRRYNDFPRIAHSVIEKMFDGNPPAFYEIPFGYNDHFEIRTLLRGAGFTDVGLTTIEMKVQAKPEDAATAFIEGNPIVNEIRELGKDVKEAKERVERVFASELGNKISKGKAQAIVVGARKPANAVAAEPDRKEAYAKPAEKKTATAKPAAKKTISAKPKPSAKK